MNALIRKFSFFIILVVLAPYSQAQNINTKAKKLFDYCYQFKFKSADSLLTIYANTALPNEQVELQLLKANLLWWKIISGDDSKQQKTTYYDVLLAAEKDFNKEKDTGFEHTYKGISLYGYLARMDGLNKNYVKAFFRINSCLKHLEKSFTHEQEFSYFYLSSGLYNYHIVNSARMYPVLKPYLYLYPKGSKVKGMEYLIIASKSNNEYLSTEANYFLMKIYMDERKYNLALPYANVLCEKYPANGLYLYYKFNILLNSDKLAEAKNVMQKMDAKLMSNAQLSLKQVLHFSNLAQADLDKKLTTNSK